MAKATFRRFQLEAADAKVKQHAVDRADANFLHHLRKLLKVCLYQHEPVSCQGSGKALAYPPNGGRVSIQRQQAPIWRTCGQNRCGMAPAAGCTVDERSARSHS